MENYDEQFNLMTESRLQVESIRSRLIEDVLRLNELKRSNNSKQKELNKSELETSSLKSTNQELKVFLVKALIEKEELLTKKKALIASIERLNQQVESVEKESNSILSSEDIEQFVKRYSIAKQISFMDKIREERSELIKYGVSPSEILFRSLF